MMARPGGSVRIGPVSIFTLIILISLAVMAVLAITTANAEQSLATKQAGIVRESYANETEAQRFLARMDAVLQKARAEGKGRAEALQDISVILPEDAFMSDAVIHASFSEGELRFLEIEIEVTDDMRYIVNTWRAITKWAPEITTLNLWPGQEDRGA